MYVDGGIFQAQGCTFTNNTALGGNGYFGQGSVAYGDGGAGGGSTGGSGGAYDAVSGIGGNGGDGGFGGGGGATTFAFGGTVGNGGDGGFGGGGGKGGFGGGGGGGAGMGGGIFSNSGSLTLTNDTFTANTAQGGTGGAQYLLGTRGLGGAVFARNGTLTATFDTFSSNTITDGSFYAAPVPTGPGYTGSDVYVLSDGAQATATITNSILGQNTGTFALDFFANQTSATGSLAPNLSGSTNNLVSNNYGGGLPGVITGTNPNFAAAGLTDNGGPTDTIALTSGSTAALGQGTTGTGITVDQRGVLRVSPPDLGAYEYGQSLPSQTITFGALANQKYGVAPLTLSATASSGLAVSFSVFSGPATISGNTLTVTGAGTVVVEATQAGDSNYAAAPSVYQSFTVAPATLTIAPTARQSMVQGAAVPALKYTASGFVNGDTASLLTGALGTTATSASPVGSYAFTTGTLSAGDNYTVVLAANAPTFAVIASSSSTPTDVSSDVSVTRSGFVHNFALGEYVQTITLTNTSATTLTGPLALVLTNLKNATLEGANGTDANGDPYIDLPAGQSLAPGQGITLTLYFKKTTSQAITYDTQVWQGLS